MAIPLKSNEIEAANRAEATALLIRAGYRVYRPEADVSGEDLVVRTPQGELRAVQMKGRPTVDWRRYGGVNVWMLVPDPKGCKPGLLASKVCCRCRGTGRQSCKGVPRQAIRMEWAHRIRRRPSAAPSHLALKPMCNIRGAPLSTVAGVGKSMNRRSKAPALFTPP
jgi:hypothetical protein